MKESKDKVVWCYSLKFLQFSRYETIMRTSFLHPDHVLMCFAADINGHEVEAAAARMRRTQQVLQGHILHVVAMCHAHPMCSSWKSLEQGGDIP